MKKVYWRVDKDIQNNEKNLLINSKGKLYKTGTNKTNIWESIYDKSIETVLGEPLTSKYNIEIKVFSLNCELKIKNISLAEINGVWVFEYMCEDINFVSHKIYESQIEKVV